MSSVPSQPTTRDWTGLAAALASFDDDRLVHLFAVRPDLARPAPRDLATLASRAGAWPSARDCYQALDRASQHVVEALCLLPLPAALSELGAVLGVAGDDADLAAAIVRLEDRALAFRLSAGEEIRLLPSLRQLDYPARLGPPLASLLSGQTGPVLEQMAHRLGVKPARTKPETLALIVAFLSDSDQVGPMVERGPDGVADLARRVAANGPLVTVKHGLYGVSDQTAAGWLVNRGLLGIADYFTGVMPREPAVALRGGQVFPPSCLRRPEPQEAPVDAGAVDRNAAERATRVVADIVAVLDQWSTEPPAVLKAGGVGIREVRKAGKLLERTEVEAARIIELAGVAGLARADLFAGVALPTAVYDEWLALETPNRWARLATAWLDADLHVSLAGAISTKDKPIAPLLDRGPERDAVHRRRVVLSVLEEVRSAHATTSVNIRDRVEWSSPAVWTGGPANAASLVAWTLDEAQLLGIAALGSLSTAGRAILGGRPAEAASTLAALVPPSVADFVVQADLTAVISGEPATAIRTELDLLGDVESKGAATVYRFSEGSVRRAFDAGRTAEDILAFLARHATRGVPQPLTYLVTDIGRRFGNVRVGAATSYLRSDDPALLAEVLQARSTSRLRLRALAPTVLVSDTDPATVTTTLQAAGYLPARESADGTLLLARPPARRAVTRSFPPRRVGAAPDLAAVVAQIRRTPLPAPAPAAPAIQPWSQPRLVGADRPAEIAKGPRAIRSLLAAACDEYWLVRLSYVDGAGRASELTVEPIETDGGNLYAECLPEGDEQRLVIDSIEWARVLTETEERML